MTTVCCVCHRTKGKRGWLKKQMSEGNSLMSHGYCPECYQATMDRIQLEQLERQGRVMGKARGK